ncbi:hypothetical protein ACU686_15555 [Yinghuangia aomiensis]
MIADCTWTHWRSVRADEIPRAAAAGCSSAASGAADERCNCGSFPRLVSPAWTSRALLAVLRAGAAYLPLDLNQPRERGPALLGDARPDVRCATPPCWPIRRLRRYPRVLDRRGPLPRAPAAWCAGAAWRCCRRRAGDLHLLDDRRPGVVVGTAGRAANVCRGGGAATPCACGSPRARWRSSTAPPNSSAGWWLGYRRRRGDDATAADPAALAALVDRHRVQVDGRAEPARHALDTARPGPRVRHHSTGLARRAFAALADAVPPSADAGIVNGTVA